jgi:putative salt-induced outer membrane protein
MKRITHAGRRAAPLLAACFALHAAPAAAQWTGRGEAGVVVAGGNTDTKAGNAKLAVGYKADAWTHAAGFAGVYSANGGVTTAQRWEATEQSNYQFDARDYWFGGLRYENDRFSGFKYQATASTGVGRKFIDTEATKFSGQVGAGYKRSETRDVVTPLGLLLTPGETDGSMALLGALEYRHAINASTTLLDKLSVEYTSDDTFAQNDLALQVRMSDKLALALGYSVRHHTDPPAGFKKTDTLTTVNVVYEVK